jgi:hypothetical protein
MLTGANRFVETGSADFQLFKFNDSSSTAAITGPDTVPSGITALQGNTGSFNGDGTGAFGFGVSCVTDCQGTSGPVIQEIRFTVTNTTLAQVETPNANGNVFVADIAIGGVSSNTGPVDSEGPASVPDGGMTLMLLGGALFGLETLRRRVRV